MGLDHRPGNAQQRRAPHLVGVQQLFKVPQSVLHQQGRNLGLEIFHEHLLHLTAEKQSRALHRLEEDISRIPVRHDHVHGALHRFPGLHIAHKVEAALLLGLLKQLVRLPLEAGSLGGLRANVQQPHPGLGPSQHPLRVIAAHEGELKQKFRRALGGGPAVNEHRTAPPGGHHRGHRRPADPLNALYQKRRPGQQRPGGAGGHKGIPLPAFEQVQPHSERGVLFLLKCGGGVVAHLYHLVGVGDGQALGQLGYPLLLERLQNVLSPAHQHHFHAVLLDCLQSALYRRLGRIVPAHCVHDNAHSVGLLL